MNFRLFTVALIICVAAWAQTAPVSAELSRARQELQRVERLAAEGVLPRTALTEAQAGLADAEDYEILSRALHDAAGVEDLDEEDVAAMIGAATRRVERQQTTLAAAQKLVDAGASSPLSLSTHTEELERRRRALEEAQSRAQLVSELIEMARAEESVEDEDLPLEAPRGPRLPAERFDGRGVFQIADLKRISTAFLKQFGRALPVSAVGSTAVHRRLGFDHRGRVDVGINPDHEEGLWLRRHLEGLAIPYFAFRQALRGRSTAPHIHIGPPSPRRAAAD